LDPQAVLRVVETARPDVIVHQLTAIPRKLDIRNIKKEFAPTNRLRTAGTDNLLNAARAVGVRRFVAQSFAGWPYARQGGPIKSEDDPLDPDPPAPLRESANAIRYVETQATQTPGIEGFA